MQSMLTELTRSGFINTETPFDPDTGIPAPGRYYLHWSHGVNCPVTCEGDPKLFSDQVKLCILKSGGALAEFLVTNRFDNAGVRVVTTEGFPKQVLLKTPTGWIMRSLAHAVLLVGWRDVDEDVVEFKFLNSDGVDYGDAGFNWIRSDPSVRSCGASMVPVKEG